MSGGPIVALVAVAGMAWTAVAILVGLAVGRTARLREDRDDTDREPLVVQPTLDPAVRALLLAESLRRHPASGPRTDGDR